MDQLIASIQENWAGYAVVTALVLPIVYFTRKYTLPAIQWAVELVVYMTGLHLLIHYVVALTAWFQFESQMKMLVEEKVHMGWQTPLLYFWKMELYKPGWLFYLEAVALVLIIAAMFRYRPMKVQKPGPKREVIHKGQVPRVRPTAPSVRPRGH